MPKHISGLDHHKWVPKTKHISGLDHGKIMNFGDILIILWIFLQNFIQKYEFYVWVYFKRGTKVNMKKI